MGKNIKLRKGYDINILGTPQTTVDENFSARTFAIKPTDFHGLSPIPKILLEVGQEIKAGQPLFYDKKNPDVLFCSPVSGELAEVKRGAKRSIAELVILADKQMTFEQHTPMNIASASRAQIVERLLKGGAWPMLKQRPFNVIADHKATPRAIFISGFSTSPLGADMKFAMEGTAADFQAGIDVLNKLAPKVHLTTNSATSATDAYANASNVEKHSVNGQHPAGCVGIQIHHIAPINKGETIWTVNPQDVAAIGRLVKDGRFDTARMMCVGGPEVKNPRYVRTYLGAGVSGFTKDNLSNDHVRYISGDVLTGKNVGAEGHMGFFDNCLSVIEEGDKFELFGWLLPSYPRPSISGTFLSTFLGSKGFKVNTNTHGEHRAMVVTGAFEKVTPMDVYPMQLLKSIMYRDFDQMEGLGIYEVVEEDLALCEFVCPSKTEVQGILRDGLDYMRSQA